MDRENVYDWMSADLITVTPMTTLHKAHHIMQEADIRHLPVVLDGQLLGLITLNQVRRAELEIAAVYKGSDLEELVSQTKSVEEVMADYTPTIVPDASIAEAAQLLLDRKLTATAVVHEGRLVGILTESDIFRFVAHLRQSEIG